MRIELTMTECKWLADLAHKAMLVATQENFDTPHPLIELRRDNMAHLESKLNSAMQKNMMKERRNAR